MTDNKEKIGIRKVLLAEDKVTETAPKTFTEAMHHEFKFWSTQPVPQFGTPPIADGVNEPIKPKNGNTRPEAYPLPDGFAWSELNVENQAELEELHRLLADNCLEDEESALRSYYTPETLKWILTPPGFESKYHLGVRVSKTGKLVGFIAGLPLSLRINGKELLKSGSVHLLCVMKRLRSKRLAPMLIRELQRRAELGGIQQAVFATTVCLPRPVASLKTWTRLLNPKQLHEKKLLQLPMNMTLQRLQKVYRLPDEPMTKGFRPAMRKDVTALVKLVNSFLAGKTDLNLIFDEKSASHWLLPRKGAIESFVVEAENGSISDFISFYLRRSTAVGQNLDVANLFYYASATVKFGDLVNDAMISAKKIGCDLFCCLDNAENAQLFDGLRFKEDSDVQNYYLYNWQCPDFKPSKIGLLLP